jgi:hypothetical protein
MMLKHCRECNHKVDENAFACPSCGAPYPARAEWSGWGYEYRSKTRVFGLPLLHISFKFRPNRMPVPAVGVISIGQFGAGIVNISQFGVGVFRLSQFAIAGYAVAQFAVAYSCIAQFGIYIDKGAGQMVRGLGQLLAGL